MLQPPMGLLCDLLLFQDHLPVHSGRTFYTGFYYQPSEVQKEKILRNGPANESVCTAATLTGVDKISVSPEVRLWVIEGETETLGGGSQSLPVVHPLQPPIFPKEGLPF